MGLPRELASQILSFCDKKSYITLSAANKMLHSMTIFRTPTIDVDLQTHDIRSISWVCNALFNGYIWLTGTKPFNKELANPKTMIAASLLASKKLQVSHWLVIKNYTHQGWNVFVHKTGAHNLNHIILTNLQAVDMGLFSETLKTSTTLTKLGLQWCNSGSTSLGDAFKENRSVKSLTLHCNSMNFSHLFDSLKENETLTELTMMHQTLYCGDIAALRTLCETNTILTTLNIGNEDEIALTLSTSLDTDAIYAFANLLKTNTTLKNVSLASKYIDRYNATMQSFAEVLSINTTLKKLTLRTTLGTMHDESLVLIAEAFKINTSLMELNLRGIDFSYPEMHNITDIRDSLKALPELAQIKPNYMVTHDPRLGSFKITQISF